MIEFELEPRGPFRLASAARFIAGWLPAGQPGAAADGEAVVRLGFLVDDWSGHAGVVLRQDDADGPVRISVVESTASDPARVRDQAARIVSLDHDGIGYAALGEREAAIGRLQRASDWLRPVIFHSPYEAACWAVISARIRQVAAGRVRDELSAEHGGRVTIEGEELLTFPSPERLLAVTDVPGLSDERFAACTASRGPRSRGTSTASACSHSTPTERSTSCVSCGASAPSGPREFCCARSARPMS